MAYRATSLFHVGMLVVAAIVACGQSEPTEEEPPPTGDDDDDNSSGRASSSSGKGGSSGQPAQDGFTVTTEESMEFEGRTRSYLLSKPKNLEAGKKYPLVLNFHGNPGDMAGQRATMHFEEITKGDAVVVYPAAAEGNSWAWYDGNPDFNWVGPLIQELAGKANVDPKNVLGFGYSGGAYFLSQYACRFGGVLKMVAIYAGGAPEVWEGDQQRENDCVVCPGGAVPFLIAHGENDNSEVSFEGGNYARWCWGDNNGCTFDDFDDGVAPCKKAKGCNQPMTWCPIPGQDHGPWLPAMQQSWDMFKSLP